MLAAGGAARFYSHGKRTGGTPRDGRRNMGGGPPVSVRAAEANSGDIDVSVDARGTVTAPAMATVKARVNGLLARVPFAKARLRRKADYRRSNAREWVTCIFIQLARKSRTSMTCGRLPNCTSEK